MCQVASFAIDVLIYLGLNLLQCLEHVDMFFTILPCKIGAQQEQSIGVIVLFISMNIFKNDLIVQ
jgi:hypothetical protein